jgi:hypothetical protein
VYLFYDNTECLCIGFEPRTMVVSFEPRTSTAPPQNDNTKVLSDPRDMSVGLRKRDC